MQQGWGSWDTEVRLGCTWGREKEVLEFEALKTGRRGAGLRKLVGLGLAWRGAGPGAARGEWLGLGVEPLGVRSPALWDWIRTPEHVYREKTGQLKIRGLSGSVEAEEPDKVPGARLLP